MKKKKEVKPKEEFDILGVYSIDEYGKTPLPEGVTHIELEIDYNGCYYEGDRPSYSVIAYKKKS